MPENYGQNEEIIVGNRRLRKVKRPKQHATPISVEGMPNNYVSDPSQNAQYYSPTAPQNAEYYSQEAPTYESLTAQGYEQNDQNYAEQQMYSDPSSQYTPNTAQQQMYSDPSLQYTSNDPQSYMQEQQNTSNVPQFYQPQTNDPNSYRPEENYVQEDPYAYDDNQQYQNINPSYSYNTIEKKKVIWIGVLCLCVGAFIGALMFGGNNSQVVQNGLQGVVINPEVPKGRARCGVAEKMQGCVLYVMNPQRQELNGRDFYDLASQLTGRQRFVIETGNMRYSSFKIKPGAIAQLNIPPLQ